MPSAGAGERPVRRDRGAGPAGGAERAAPPPGGRPRPFDDEALRRGAGETAWGRRRPAQRRAA
ncbi:hypothetical protein STXM2123_2036 [Streptomyces sp. F-3]|nr:hypothetical protein STXM2123_2036 [Streptomyces sp. F-3]